MNKVLTQVWKEEDGVLTFEWVLLVTLLTIGIVSGLAAARDAIIDEMGDVAEAMLALDQSFHIDFPLALEVHDSVSSGSGSDSEFNDTAQFVDCARTSDPIGQGSETDGQSSVIP
jgi:Flp pilus assembly pilin Flp